MINPYEFVKEFGNKNNGQSIQFATVDVSYSNGKPKLFFDGEANLSTKGYPYIKSFTPVANERVMIINGVIIGAIEEG